MNPSSMTKREVVRLKLIEYRPGRYAWADPATGKVVRKATAEEADAELEVLVLQLE